MKYKFIIKITGSGLSKIIEPIEIENEFASYYFAQNELKNIGTNGLMYDVDNNKIYYPPHRILEIKLESLD